MKKILNMIAAGAIVLASCDQAPKFHVEGTIEEAKDSMLYFAQSTLEGVKNLDSVKLGESGTFSFKTSAPKDCPEFYLLRIGEHIIHFSVDSTESLTFAAKLPTMESDYTVSGNESSEKIREISLMQQQVQRRLVEIEQNEDMYPGDKVDSIEHIINQYKERVKMGYIFTDPKSAAAYYAVCQSLTDMRGTFMLFNPLTDRSDVKCYATVATSWDGTYPDAPRTKQLCNMAIKGMDNTAKPQQKVVELDEKKVKETGIIDINLPDINSNLHSILDLKGKVVLIDFTAYAAKESAERTRLMRSLYEKYHGQGFEIYQISLDDDVHFWKFSCENLPWVCVHETDGNVTNIYGVANLPTFFLVNRDNEIVLRSDFMEGTLEDNIRKLL
ncbi:MAG: AhpC/TSA family protein [Bacteroidaceae bacterium]|nr:AhpC/TSA family protein [Bacteroidaceae bacterium]